MTVLFVSLLLTYIITVQANCDEQCKIPLTPYKEIGCEPHYNNPSDCCPSYYDCAKFEEKTKTACSFQNVTYNLHDQINTDDTLPYCAASCFCSKSAMKDIECAQVECPEYFGTVKLEPGCIKTYNLKSCCSKGSICPPFEKLAKCEYNGQIYYEGQRIPTDDSFLTCVCGPNFSGKLDSNFCIRTYCGIELRNAAHIREKCAPVFYGTGHCPIQWNCQEDGDTIIAKAAARTTDKQCLFGSKTLNVGDELVLNRTYINPSVTCKCEIPPLVTCIHKTQE